MVGKGSLGLSYWNVHIQNSLSFLFNYIFCLSSSFLQMRILDKFPIEGGQKDPKSRIIPFLPGNKHDAQPSGVTVGIAICFRSIPETVPFGSAACWYSYTLHSIAYRVAWFLSNFPTPPRPNQFVVSHVSRRLEGRDLSNLINSLYGRAEESSEEILC